MNPRPTADFRHGQSCGLGAPFDLCNDSLLVHDGYDISNNANIQVHKCKETPISLFAKASSMKTDDQRLLSDLMAHAGLSLSAIAKAAKLTPSTLTRPYSQEVGHQLSNRTMDKLKAAFPDFDRWSDRASPPSNASIAPPMEGASERRMRRDVPIFGTALGADEVVDGESIEQTTLNLGEIIGYRRRPVLLDGRTDVYSLYVQGSSMDPRHRDGAVLFVEGNRQPKIGDDAVIYLRIPDGHDGERPSSVLVKTLTKKNSQYIELEQYNPNLRFRLPMSRVYRMDRVLTLDDLTD